MHFWGDENRDFSCLWASSGTENSPGKGPKITKNDWRQTREKQRFKGEGTSAVRVWQQHLHGFCLLVYTRLPATIWELWSCAERPAWKYDQSATTFHPEMMMEEQAPCVSLPTDMKALKTTTVQRSCFTLWCTLYIHYFVKCLFQ